MRVIPLFLMLASIVPPSSHADSLAIPRPLVGLLRTNKKGAVLAFQHDGTSWIHVTKPLASLPPQWFEVFDGKTLGPIELGSKQNIIPGRDSLEEYRVLQTRIEAEVRSTPKALGKVRGQKDEVLKLRPIAIVSQRATDPDNWKPAKKIPNSILLHSRKKFFETYCPEQADLPYAKMAEYLPLSKADRNLNFTNSTSDIFLLQFTPLASLIKLRSKTGCRLGHSDYGARIAYFARTDGSVTEIGGDVNMIEAADFDADNSSELLLSGNFGAAVYSDMWPGPSPSLTGIILISTKTFKGPIAWTW